MPIGVLINCSFVLTGGICGAVFGKKIPARIADSLSSVFGLSAMVMGICCCIMVENLSAVILAMILGTALGEGLRLETKLSQGLRYIEKKSPVQINEEKEAVLINMIVLFCFSGTGIFGALYSGMTGEHSILISKAIMDFFTAIIFGASAGWLVGMISIPQGILGLSLFYGSSLIMPIMTEPVLNDFKACGGIITLAVGFKIAGIKHWKVLNMLPAIILVLFISHLFN